MPKQGNAGDQAGQETAKESERTFTAEEIAAQKARLEATRKRIAEGKLKTPSEKRAAFKAAAKEISERRARLEATRKIIAENKAAKKEAKKQRIKSKAKERAKLKSAKKKFAREVFLKSTEERINQEEVRQKELGPRDDQIFDPESSLNNLENSVANTLALLNQEPQAEKRVESDSQMPEPSTWPTQPSQSSRSSESSARGDGWEK